MQSRKPVIDYLIVGTGPSGYFLTKSILARDPQARVTVLEAGSKAFDMPSSLPMTQQVGKNFLLDPTHNIGFGGTSQLWHNVLAPLDAEDFEPKSWIDNSGWDISLSDLEDGYIAACREFGFDYEIFQNPNKFFDFDLQAKRLQWDPEHLCLKLFIHPRNYLRTDKTFKKLIKRYNNLTLRLGYTALKLTDSMHGLWVFCNETGKTEQLIAKKIILCAGALNTPKILLNTPTLEEGLPAAGKYLMDHPMGNLYQFEYQKSISAPLFSRLKFEKNINAKVAIRLKPDKQRKMRLPNTAFYARPAFSKGANSKTEALKRSLFTIRKDLMKGRVPFKTSIFVFQNMNLLRQILEYKTGISNRHRLTDIMFVSEQIPDPRSCIRKTGKKIEIAPNIETPEYEIDWKLSRLDIEANNTLFPIINDHLAVPNNAASTIEPTSVSWADTSASAAHHLGTARMSTSVKNGCVDRNLKVHTTENVFICDGSVFPTGGNANPTLTCMALAARLAEHLYEN